MTFWDISTLKSPCSWVAPPVVPNRNSKRRARVCDDCCGRLELLERFEKSHEIASVLLRQVQREPRVVEVHDLFERRCLDVPLTEATTSSLEALRAYSQGLKTWNTKGEVEAPPYLKRALELDPQFASAYEKTIEVLRNVTSLNGTSGQLWLSRLELLIVSHCGDLSSMRCGRACCGLISLGCEIGLAEDQTHV